MKTSYAPWMFLASLAVACATPVDSRAQTPTPVQTQPPPQTAPTSEFTFARTIGHAPEVGEPRGFAVDRLGNLFVADRFNGKILRITAGVEMQTFLVPTNTLKRPADVAVDRAGNLIVVDESGPLVQRYSATGVLLRSWDMSKSPGGVTVDAENNIYVTDQAENLVKKYDTQGRLLTSWGGKGNKPGMFLGARGVAVDRQGNVYVADEYNNRIQKFSPTGAFLAASDPNILGTTVSGGLGPMDLAVDSTGHIWVAAHTNFAVYKLDPKFAIQVRLETFGRRDGQLAGPIAVAVDAQDNLLVLDNSRRIQKFTPEGNFITKFEFPPAQPGEFVAPTGVAVDQQGNLYVSDTANFRIQKFDANGNFLLTFGRFGQGDGEFNGAESIAIDRFGNLYVVDSHNHRIQKFDANGTFLLKWGSFGAQNGEFNRTKVVVVDLSRDFVYVNDWHNNRVQKFDLNGTFLAAFGNSGPSSTQALGPTGLAVDGQGNVFVSSWFNNAIQKFDASGNFLASLGGPGSGDGQFKGPARMAMGPDGNLIVADWGNSRVQILDTEGRFVTKFGTLGQEPGQFNQPVGIAADQGGNVFVGDASNARVQVFGRSSALSSASMAKQAAGRAPALYGIVALYDISRDRTQEFEAALAATVEAARSLPAFVNERVLRNVDPLTLQYATYAKFNDRAAAEQFLADRLAKLTPLCRRAPEVHLARLTHAFSPEGVSDHPNGLEYGRERTGQIAHLGLFVPFPKYRREYDDVLYETKVLTRDLKPAGYIGEDVLVETELVRPEVQAPYTPRALEPERMSLNYGEYQTMENAEDSYIKRQESGDPKLVTMERVFFSTLQVPTRFYIFQVIGNHRRTGALAQAR